VADNGLDVAKFVLMGWLCAVVAHPVHCGCNACVYVMRVRVDDRDELAGKEGARGCQSGFLHH